MLFASDFKLMLLALRYNSWCLVYKCYLCVCQVIVHVYLICLCVCLGSRLRSTMTHWKSGMDHQPLLPSSVNITAPKHLIS